MSTNEIKQYLWHAFRQLPNEPVPLTLSDGTEVLVTACFPGLVLPDRYELLDRLVVESDAPWAAESLSDEPAKAAEKMANPVQTRIRWEQNNAHRSGD